MSQGQTKPAKAGMRSEWGKQVGWSAELAPELGQLCLFAGLAMSNQGGNDAEGAGAPLTCVWLDT